MEQRQSGRNIHLVALDMDGTLLSNDKTLSEKNRDVLKQAIEQGIHIVPATGRPMSGLPKALLENVAISYAICSNGAAVMDLKQEKAIYHCYLSKEMVIDLIHALQPFDPIIDIFAEGKVFTEGRNMKRLDQFLIPASMLPYIYDTRICVEDLLTFVASEELNIEKINLYFQSIEVREQVIARLQTIPHIAVTSSLNHNLEINHQNANKGFALKWLALNLGLSMDEVMACGDSDNDREMLVVAGLAIAMENATEGIKRIADAITLSNEESGVAAAIEKYVL